MEGIGQALTAAVSSQELWRANVSLDVLLRGLYYCCLCPMSPLLSLPVQLSHQDRLDVRSKD